MKKYIYVLLALICLFSCRKIDLQSFTPETPVLSTNTNSLNVPNQVTAVEIEVEANLPWRLVSNVDWISIVEGSGLKSGRAKISVAKNSLLVSRTGTLTLYIDDTAKRSITVTQEAGDPIPVIVKQYYVKSTGNDTNDGLSWNKAINLHKALSLANEGDIIHIASGIYTPSVPLTGGTSADNSFEVSKNIKIIGGYPTNAVDGDNPNPTVNPTILSGNNTAYHVLAIYADKITGAKVSINGVTIRDGNATGSGTLSVNGVSLARNYAGGILASRADIELNNCIVTNNSATNSGAIFITNDAQLTLKNTKVISNSATGNGGAIWNDGANLYLYNSEVSSNTAGGVAAGLYAYHASKKMYNYVYNSTIANNQALQRSAIYARQNAIFYLVNSTIYGNTSSNGATALSTHAAGSEINVISSTVSNNTSTSGTGDAMTTLATGGPIRVYNSIVINNGATPTNKAGNEISFQSSILDAAVYDNNGNLSSSVADPSALVKPYANYGALGNSTPLLNNGSVAHTSGMVNTQLEILFNNLSLDKTYYLIDQNNKNRTNKAAMGAAIE